MFIFLSNLFKIELNIIYNRCTTKKTSLLNTIIDVKVVKTITSFLTYFF